MNILGIGRDKSQSQYFTVGDTNPEDETEGRHEVATPPETEGRHEVATPP